MSLAKALVAALALDQVAAFHTPVSRVSGSRTSAVSMNTNWRRSYDGKGTGTGAVAAAAAPAASGSLSVAQACKFYAANPSVSEAEKTAFLKSKGVSDFVIAQANCAATGEEDTVYGHPGEPGYGPPAAKETAGTVGMSVAQACAFYAANPSVDEAEKTAFLKSQGVSDFVIAQASCAATGMEKTVAGHP